MDNMRERMDERERAAETAWREEYEARPTPEPSELWSLNQWHYWARENGVSIPDPGKPETLTDANMHAATVFGAIMRRIRAEREREAEEAAALGVEQTRETTREAMHAALQVELTPVPGRPRTRYKTSGQASASTKQRIIRELKDAIPGTRMRAIAERVGISQALLSNVRRDLAAEYVVRGEPIPNWLAATHASFIRAVGERAKQMQRAAKKK